MTTLVGLDLTGRRVVVVGAGAVGTRRARRLIEDGARVVLVDPSPSDDARRMASHGDVEVVERAVVASDVDGAWLVVAATADPALNAEVARWCLEGRSWCVNASDGRGGTARVAASSTHGDLTVGVVSGGDPDPGRVATVRDALAAHVESGAVDLRRRRKRRGRVVLVGSGPGDPGLVPVAGLEALATADVVVTDRLGATALLDRLPADVEIVNVGKSPTNHPVPQAEINAILVDRALRGLTVVRFKGGDPYVFGRGGEEVHACRRAGVEVSVVPGITSAFSVPALAGIPVTQRGVATSVHVTLGARRRGCRSPRRARGRRNRGVPHGGVGAARHLRRGAGAGRVAGPPGRHDRAGVDRNRAGDTRDRRDGRGRRHAGRRQGSGDHRHGAGGGAGLPRRPGVRDDRGVRR